jgi:hypothetical protein
MCTPARGGFRVLRSCRYASHLTDAPAPHAKAAVPFFCSLRIDPGRLLGLDDQLCMRFRDRVTVASPSGLGRPCAIQMHTHTYICIQIHSQIHSQIQCMYLYSPCICIAPGYTNTCICIQIHTQINVCICTAPAPRVFLWSAPASAVASPLYTFVYKYIHTFVYICVQIHTQILCVYLYSPCAACIRRLLHLLSRVHCIHLYTNTSTNTMYVFVQPLVWPLRRVYSYGRLLHLLSRVATRLCLGHASRSLSLSTSADLSLSLYFSRSYGRLLHLLSRVATVSRPCYCVRVPGCEARWGCGRVLY